MGSQSISDTLRYINLTGLVTGETLRYINLAGLVIGLVTLCGPMNLCPCVSDECGENVGTRTTLRSDVL